MGVSESVWAAGAATAAAARGPRGTRRSALTGAGAQARGRIRRALPRRWSTREGPVHFLREALQAAQGIQDRLALRRARKLRGKLVDGALAHLSVRAQKGPSTDRNRDGLATDRKRGGAVAHREQDVATLQDDRDIRAANA